MLINKKIFTFFIIITQICFNVYAFAQTSSSTTLKNPDYVQEFIGKDKYENLNRKIFKFNSKLNKYAIRPIHILWASIIPQYGIDRFQGIYQNALYPRKLVSSLIQKDFKTAGNETIRFITNSTIGVGGMFDPANKYLKIEPKNTNMEQALSKYNVKSGPYLVCPILSASSPRALIGKALDTALDPTSYLGIPFMAFAKIGLTINNTGIYQPFSIFMESAYADPYDINRKFYAIENYIKNSPIITKNVEGTILETNDSEDFFLDLNEEFIDKDTDNFICLNCIAADESIFNELRTQCFVEFNPDDYQIEETHPIKTCNIKADINLENYNAQGPVVDALRTIYFDLPGIDKSVWSELSIWNRSFAKRLKTDSVEITPNKKNYKFRYIMQKNKNAPLVIIYPSIGESIMSHHSIVLAKLFYEKGYSAIIQPSHFQWESIKSMPDNHFPGIPTKDIYFLQSATNNIIKKLEEKYNCNFDKKTVIGTSFGAMMTLYLGDLEQKNPTILASKYIAINPPIELIYAMEQFDKNAEEWIQNPNEIKEQIAATASKVLELMENKKSNFQSSNTLPFDEEEAKLITSFVMHQKLSDLILTIESLRTNKTHAEIYKMINNMNYKDYTEKYLLSEEYKNIEDLNKTTSLQAISNYLETNDNYLIYHSIDDYIVTQEQLSQLKNYCGNKLKLLSNGSHLGFLYRQEFIDELRKNITLPIKEET